MYRKKKSFFRRPIFLSIFVLLGLTGFALVGCEQFGAIPKGEYLTVVEQSPQYDGEEEVFVNRRPEILETMTVWENFWADPFGREEPNFLFNSNQGEPEAPLPEDRNPNLGLFQQSDDAV